MAVNMQRDVPQLNNVENVNSSVYPSQDKGTMKMITLTKQDNSQVAEQLYTSIYRTIIDDYL